MTDVLSEILDEDVEDVEEDAEEVDADSAEEAASAPESVGQTMLRVLKRIGLWYVFLVLILLPARGLHSLVRRRPSATAALATAMTILGTFLLGFVVDAGIVGRIRHDRDRQNEYAHLRYDLADGTAPLGAVDSDGTPIRVGTPVAVLQIPSIGVHEVVDYGTTSSVLMSGPGLRRDTVLPGQAGTSVILGRHALYGAPFGSIDQLQPGETIRTITGQGVSDFKVVDVRRAGDHVPAEVVSAPATLILTTADGSSLLPDGVLRVDAVLVDPKAVLDPGPVAHAAADDQPLAGEGEAWIPLVLWGQGLLAAAIAVTWLRARWGKRQAWLVGAPVLAALGLAAADTFARLLPNVM